MADELITHLNAYGLVCGLQYERYFRKELVYEKAAVLPLFRTYPDAEIAWSGPWIIQLDSASEYRDQLLELAQKCPSVTWIKSENDIDQLAAHLAQQLNVRLEDGRIALFRFYDPRVLHRVKDILAPPQREEMLQGIAEWRYSLAGSDYALRLNAKGLAS
ncbi:DUF4123 domain-containing protein [Candidatus Symbiopectobacterium sp. NZEC135]|uniref:DUF4123 domain-containing protein n=1 Tax=Candidatus Symbiopectobacterium sp. NZEC135 TaxID=2820471 RepID=UPI00222776AA|nr:DUF4123 domain-containing protein [Candidatus Symbiopectobacterium sp. NZEC135]MCW2478072.1 DUF4123 domain-containing protein [Candidatus Symbiopectobacterium sp. NZEC135]